MTKTITITCDICDADITRASRIEVSWINNSPPSLDVLLHFCGYEHMYQFLDKRRPKESENIE